MNSVWWIPFAALLLSIPANASSVVPSNKFRIGDGAASNKTIEFNKGLGATNPKFRWSEADGKLQFSNDGTNFKALGSGSGSGDGGVNVLENPGFEDGALNWTASTPAHLTITETVGQVIAEERSGMWDPATSGDTLVSQLIDTRLFKRIQGNQCLAQVYYTWTGTTGQIVLEARDGNGSVLASADLIPSINGVVSPAFVVFTCPEDSGTLADRQIDLRLRATANANAITLDSVHLGSNIRGVQVGSAQWFGSIQYDYAANCQWSTTSTSFASFAADTDCATPTVSGKVTAPGTKIPGLVFASMPAGDYQFVVTTSWQADTFGTSADQELRLSDGTTGFGSANNRVNSAQTDSMGAQGPIIGLLNNGASRTNVTVQLQGRTSTASNGIGVGTGNTDLGPFRVDVYYYPKVQDSAIEFDTSSQHWSGAHGSDCLWQETSTSYDDPPVDASCTLSQIKNSGFGSVTSHNDGTPGNNLPGIVFTPTRSGTFYACAVAQAGQSNSGQQVSVQMTDGSNNKIAESGQFNGAAAHIGAVTLCGLVPVPVAGSPFTMKLRLKASANTASIDGNGQNDAIQWSIFRVDQPQVGVTFPNVPSTPSGSEERVVRAKLFIDGTTPAIISQSGLWISAPTALAAGQSGFTMSGFSGNPACTCAPVDAGRSCSLEVNSATAIDVYRRNNNSDADENGNLDIICMGPR